MYKLIFLLLLFLFVSCSPKLSGKRQSTYTSKEYIRAHLSFLASDNMEGREATKRGARVAADYIATQLQLFGVQPYGDNGTYFQNFPMYLSSYDPGAHLVLNENGSREQIKLGTHFLPYNSGNSGKNLKEMVFVGYGITDSLYNYDDYKGLDIRGKIVVMLSGKPSRPDDNTFFKGAKSSQWSRSRSKRKLAKNYGASGIIILPDIKAVQRFARYKQWFLSEQFKLDPPQQEVNSNPPAIIVDSTLAKRILNWNDRGYNSLLKEIQSGKLLPGKRLIPTISILIKKETHKASARNVVGILPGRDPHKANELVVVSAHYDHLGIRDTVVYNGADDNGSGTTSILESAHQLAYMANNDRSVLYVFFTGEEKGLLGSIYFTDHFKQMDKVMAEINMDMVGRGATDSLYVIGSGRISPEYYQMVETANKQSAHFNFNYLLDDENHPSNIYHRSDHWNFAKHGIPIVFFFDYDMQDYHSPRDDFSKINIKKIERVIRLTTKLTLSAANLNHWLYRPGIE